MDPPAAAPAGPRRAGLWSEVALALALITLATLVLNAGVFWLLLKRTEEERRTDLALALSAALTAQLEVEASRADDRDAGYRRVLSAYQATNLDLDALYVAEPSMRTVASVRGQAPATPDTGLRAALYGSQQFIDITGPHWGARFVEVSSPIAPRGRPVAALRVSIPLKAPAVPGGVVGFAAVYVGGSFVLVSLFGFTLFRRSLIRPVQSLVQGTARISGGDFGHRVELDAARELQGLCDALNTMSLSLAAYRERTEEQVARLERANVDLQAAQEALVRSEKLASVGRLAAGIAHEVGNPLSAVLGYVDLVSQGLGDEELERDLIARSRKELERINRIIRELLDFARQGSGTAEAVDVGGALVEAWSTVQPALAMREIRVELHAQPDLPPVIMERDKLHQVLVNLLLNAADALDHAEPGGGTESGGQVWLRAEAVEEDEQAWVALTCRDSGPGFDAVALDRAFEPFFTTKDVGEGTGLGLATCLQVVEGVGGRITAANHPDGGAVVRILLPVGDRVPSA